MDHDRSDITNATQISSCSFAQEKQWDNAFKMYQSYLADSKLCDSDDFDLDISDDELDVKQIFTENRTEDGGGNAGDEGLTRNAVKTLGNWQKLTDTNVNQELMGSLEGIREKLPAAYLGKSVQFESSKDLLRDKDKKELIEFICNLIKDVKIKQEQYPEKIARLLKSQYDEILTESKKKFDAEEANFKDTLETIEKHSLNLKSTYDMIKETIDKVKEQKMELKKNMEKYELGLELFENKQS